VTSTSGTSSATRTTATATSTTQSTTTTPLYVVTSSMSFESSGTEDEVTDVVTSHLSNYFGVDDDQLSVSVASSSARSVSSSWDVEFEVVAPIDSAEQLFNATSQVVANPSNFTSALQSSFQLQGLDMVETSLGVTPPEIKIITATVTTVSKTRTSTTASSGTTTSNYMSTSTTAATATDTSTTDGSVAESTSGTLTTTRTAAATATATIVSTVTTAPALDENGLESSFAKMRQVWLLALATSGLLGARVGERL